MRERVSSFEPLFSFDRDLRVVSWNPACEELTGFDSADVIGRHCFDVLAGIAPDGRPICVPDCPYARRLASGDVPPGPTALIRTKRGQRRLARFAFVAMEAGGNVRYLHLVQPLESPPSAHDGLAQTLTVRQRSVLELVAQDLSTREIARRLGLAETTVRNHVRLILFKLDAETRAQAVSRARNLGMLD